MQAQKKGWQTEREALLSTVDRYILAVMQFLMVRTGHCQAYA